MGMAPGNRRTWIGLCMRPHGATCAVLEPCRPPQHCRLHARICTPASACRVVDVSACWRLTTPPQPGAVHAAAADLRSIPADMAAESPQRTLSGGGWGTGRHHRSSCCARPSQRARAVLRLPLRAVSRPPRRVWCRVQGSASVSTPTPCRRLLLCHATLAADAARPFASSCRPLSMSCAGWRSLLMHAPMRVALPCHAPACLQLRLWPACVGGLHAHVSPPNDDRQGSVHPSTCTSRKAEGHMQPTRTITLALAWLSCSAGASREATHDWEHAAAQQACQTQHAQVMQQRAEVDTIGHMVEMQHALHCQSPHIILLSAAQSVPWFSQQESREPWSPQMPKRPLALAYRFAQLEGPSEQPHAGAASTQSVRARTEGKS